MTGGTPAAVGALSADNVPHGALGGLRELAAVLVTLPDAGFHRCRIGDRHPTGDLRHRLSMSLGIGPTPIFLLDLLNELESKSRFIAERNSLGSAEDSHQALGR